MIYDWIYRNVIFPGFHAVKKDGVNSALKRSTEAGALSPESLEKLQSKKLQDLLCHAYESVPYYHKCLSDAGVDRVEDITPALIRQLPVMTKPLFRDHFNSLISSRVDGNATIDNSTSGSSGEPFFFKTDMKSIASRVATVIRNYGWAGISLGEKEVRLWGAQMDIKKSESIRSVIRSLITRQKILSTYTMTDNDLANYAAIINQFKPTMLVSYPGPLSVFADYCRDNHIKLPSVKAMVTSAEMLFPHQRENIESVFGIKIFNRYGSREFGDIAQEDKNHDGLRVNSDRFFVEILRDDLSPCSRGEKGELYITDLDNYGMPFIRYKIGDQASWAEQENFYQGMPFPKLNQIEGRSLDVVIAPNGNRLGGTFWTILLRKDKAIKEFQVIQDSSSLLIIKYVPEESMNSGILDALTADIKAKCGEDFDVRFETVDKFTTSDNGKHRLIIVR
ncbi:phenylacetate--CoA ligase family protein [Oceanicoccus sagamiensis]|uniref:Capsule biosynthesis protein CapK n=1 Tax=Oceanicoccus sagamiensis TaxID=716816 RepID=A0A1X9NAA4_9GAMM|nr:phenylacetate--CoA ligase family protein [Oceanicoccus sagamiensis]ARN74091.1 hypothetical protein BST96_08125 [Oceanicoccus sagamiensis]